MESEIKMKIDIISKQMINDYSYSQFAGRGIIKQLFNSLSLNDFNDVSSGNRRNKEGQ